MEQLIQELANAAPCAALIIGALLALFLHEKFKKGG